MIWSFIADFSALIAFRPLGLQQLMEAVQAGTLSLTLVNLHIALLRFIQSEAEIANAIGSVHVSFVSGPYCYCSLFCVVTTSTSSFYAALYAFQHLGGGGGAELLQK
jgi:hypothetical protein